MPSLQVLTAGGDTLVIYGDLDDIERLDRRRAGRAGDKEHRRAVDEQEELEQAHPLERPHEPPTQASAEPQGG